MNDRMKVPAVLQRVSVVKSRSEPQQVGPNVVKTSFKKDVYVARDPVMATVSRNCEGSMKVLKVKPMGMVGRS
eukprot:NODE_4091_length_332_cov_70.346290_g4009_i0.p1 GENE.NODE_4091_length_332_cov_70.346290_g4009_i0~~NODE_4091_length_332_cov_70.346290_g4009_i0.p1  ORF type:complete len:73 (+),score=6.72 NODE_4091_length_332_cov_70.346290_g4009_i0:35-253(+)